MNAPRLNEIDPEISKAVTDELDRQRNTLEMIASENIVPPEILEIQGSVLTNKYAEGYPAKRYYGGCEHVDVAEKLAIERAKELFGASCVNVQPHSGSQANMAVYFACLKPKDKIIGMNLAHGGHLTHGSPVSFSGKLYNFTHYGVDKNTGRIDMDALEELARKEKPAMIVAGASAYPRTLDFPRFAQIARSVDALLMVDMAHIAGLVAAGVHPSPVPYADVVTSTTHKTLRGPRGGLILSNEEIGKKIDKEIFPGIQGGPLMHIIAAKATAFKTAMSDTFKKYQEQVIKNAKVLSQTLLQNKIDLVSGGTDNHMMLADLTSLGITGKTAEKVLGDAGITANKNSIPFDTKGPGITSGIRLGTPALTSRGMKEKEMEEIAGYIKDVLSNPENETRIREIRGHVHKLCETFPIYPDLS